VEDQVEVILLVKLVEQVVVEQEVTDLLFQVDAL
jgi:hypothetical protein